MQRALRISDVPANRAIFPCRRIIAMVTLMLGPEVGDAMKVQLREIAAVLDLCGLLTLVCARVCRVSPPWT